MTSKAQKTRKKSTNFIKIKNFWDFLGCPVVKALHFHRRGDADLTLGWGTRIPHAAWCGKKRKLKTFA